jgi:cholesterol transport system auxiliary component
MVRNRLVATLLALALLPVLGACGPLGALRTAAAPLEAYTLQPAAFRETASATGRHVLVELPAASAAISTDRILVRPTPLQVQYLTGARWIDAAPDLVQALLVETLQNTDAFRFVTRTTAGPFPEYTLLSELIDFQAEGTGDPEIPLVTRVTLSLALVRESDGQIVSSRRFSAVRPVAGLEEFQVVSAFNATTDAVLRESAVWVLSLFGRRAS